MAYRTSWNRRAIADIHSMANIRKTEINPGDKRRPTAYRSMHYYSSESPGRVIHQDFVYKVQTVTSTFLDKGVRPLSGTQYQADQFDVAPEGSPLYADSYAKAISRLISSVLDERNSDFNAAVFMAEGGSALEHIRNSAFRVGMALRSLRKGKIRDMYRYLGSSSHHKYRDKAPRTSTVKDNAASYWLEAEYAWRPLLMDAFYGAEKLADIVLNKPSLFSARGRANTKVYTTSQGVSPPHSISRYEKVRVEAKVYFTVSSEALRLAASLGLTNPALVAWELVPFSFVYDWWHPIGNFLEALSAFDGLSFESGYVSSLREIHYQCTSGHQEVSREYGFVGGTWGLQRMTTKQFGGYTTKIVCFRRYVLTAFPKPNFPKPRFGLKNLSRVLTSLSLFHVTRR